MPWQLVHWWSARASTCDSHKREQTSLLHFPDELLLCVIEELGETELYTLSLVSKRFQRLALPAYLSRHGFFMPLNVPIERLTFSAEQLMTLPGLRLVLVTKQVRSLFCEFAIRNRPVVALSHLRRMIANNHGLEDVALRLDRWYLKRPKPLSEVCIQLLEVVAQRCTILKLSENGSRQEIVPLVAKLHEQLMEDEAAKWSGHFRDQPSNGLCDLLAMCIPLRILRYVSSWLSLALKTYTSPEPTPPPRYTLKTLVLRTPAFLLPPYTGWTFRLLNTVPLTRLDLVDIHLSSRASAAFFGALTIPTLHYLRVIACWFEFHAFSQFLSRHDTISALDLVYPNLQRLPRGALPGLVSLKSIPINLCHLLLATDTFPKLSQVRVVIYLSLDDQFVFSSVEGSLAVVAQRLVESNIRIGLDVFMTSRTNSWINLKSVWDCPHNYPVLSRVREIAFSMPDPDMISSSAIPVWLSTFPLLEHVEFLDGTLLQYIVQHCAGIRSAKIDEEWRSVASWLAEADSE